MSTIFEILTKAKAKISNPLTWTPDWPAVNKHGFYEDPQSSKAVRFDAIGSIDNVCGFSKDEDAPDEPQRLARLEAIRTLNGAGKSLYGRAEAIGVNAWEGHDGVMRMFDRALEAIK